MLYFSLSYTNYDYIEMYLLIGFGGWDNGPVVIDKLNVGLFFARFITFIYLFIRFEKGWAKLLKG